MLSRFCACFSAIFSGGFLMCFFECMHSKLRPYDRRVHLAVYAIILSCPLMEGLVYHGEGDGDRVRGDLVARDEYYLLRYPRQPVQLQQDRDDLARERS